MGGVDRTTNYQTVSLASVILRVNIPAVHRQGGVEILVPIVDVMPVQITDLVS